MTFYCSANLSHFHNEGFAQGSFSNEGSWSSEMACFLKTVVHRAIVFFGKREIVSDNYFLQTLFLQDCY